MSRDSRTGAVDRPGLVWGVDFLEQETRPVDDIELLKHELPRGFRWLHLNLADQRTQRWLAGAAPLPPHIRELLLSPDPRPRAVAEDDMAGLVLQDLERDFDEGETRTGVMRLAVGPSLMISARYHPMRSADIVRQRIAGGATAHDPAAAAELMLAGMAESVRRTLTELTARVQQVEDGLLANSRTPDARAFVVMRSLMVRLHRLLQSGRGVLGDLAGDPVFGPALVGVGLKSAERLAGLDGELLAVQGQLRLLREELDLQATQRTNQNLYILSILTALMLPATLVTGFFGMNTGGLPFAHPPWGTAAAGLVAAGSAVAVYVALRLMGFIRR